MQARGERPGDERTSEDMDGGADARRITIYTPEDFAGMRAAGRLAAETLDMITPHVAPGVSTGALDRCVMSSFSRMGRLPPR